MGPYLLVCAVAAALLSLTRIQQLQDAEAVDLGRERGLARFEFVREDDKLTIDRTRIVFRPFPGKPSS